MVMKDFLMNQINESYKPTLIDPTSYYKEFEKKKMVQKLFIKNDDMGRSRYINYEKQTKNEDEIIYTYKSNYYSDDVKIKSDFIKLALDLKTDFNVQQSGEIKELDNVPSVLIFENLSASITNLSFRYSKIVQDYEKHYVTIVYAGSIDKSKNGNDNIKRSIKVIVSIITFEK